MSSEPTLTHVNQRGDAHMVDVSAKTSNRREALARSILLVSPEAADALERATLKKGDAISTARIAGIMAAKRTHELIPLCHPLKLSSIEINIELKRELPQECADLVAHNWCSLFVDALVVANDRTGVEMEALTAANVAALTLYDMLKAIDKSMVIASCRLLEKRGGKSGDYNYSAPDVAKE